MALCLRFFVTVFQECHILKALEGIKEILFYPRLKPNVGGKVLDVKGALVLNKMHDDLKTEQSLLIFKYKCNEVSLVTWISPGPKN